MIVDRLHIDSKQMSCMQSWGSYFMKVIYYILPRVTSYFYQEVIYYSYILLHQKSNFVILLYYFIAFKSNNIM